MALIVMLFFQLVVMVSYNATANLAGDENQLPQNEKMIDLKNGVSNNNLCYYKGNYLVWGVTQGQGGQSFFDGTHLMAPIGGGNGAYSFLTLQFPYPLKITRIRIYPMGNNPSGQGDLLGCNSVTISNLVHFHMTNAQGYYYGGMYYGPDLFTSNTNAINQKTDYIQALFPNLITMEIAIKFESTSVAYINEIEIYYDNTFNPYPHTSEISNFYNYTNITNEYYNETNNIYENKTYQNDTYYNETYVDNTYLDETYLNETYLTETYTGNYTDILHRNITYANYTNQTGGTSNQNTTNEFFNYTYLNETVLQDQRLEVKLNMLMDRLNNSKETDVKETKSVVDETYVSPLLIILLIAILVFQLVLFLQRRKKKEKPPEKEPMIEGEIEYTPDSGFISGEEQAISRVVQQPGGEVPYSDYPSSDHPYSFPPPQPSEQQLPPRPPHYKVPRDHKVIIQEPDDEQEVLPEHTHINEEQFIPSEQKEMDDDYQPPKYTGDILTSRPEDSEFPLVITTGDLSTPKGCYHLYNILLAKKGSGIRISQESGRDEISKARKQIIMMYHPDKWQDNKEKATFFIQKVNVAWEVLSSDKRIDKTFRV